MKLSCCSILALAMLCSVFNVYADERSDEKDVLSKGYLSGSFETNTNYYKEDGKTSAVVPDGKSGSNNYLKLDYYNDNFSAGLQLEAYAPVLVGYPSDLKGAALTNYYVKWADDDFSVTAGSFYEQFGSGLLFRSWEDRALGLNNAIMGARVTYSYKDIVAVKALWGMPRFGMKFSQTQVKGADASFAVSNLAGWQNIYWALEGSVLDRYEALDDKRVLDGCSPNTVGWSARTNLETNGFYLKAEYVDAGQKYYYNTSYSGEGQMYHRKRGNAQLIETGYNGHGLGVNMSLRRLEWMDSKVLTESNSTVNMLNYVPAMCTQYTYMLATLHPYGARTGEISSRFTNSGEIGGQLDVFYNFRRGTVLGGKRGMRVHANFSTYHTIAQEGTFKAGNMLFRDLSVDIERQWTKKFKSTLLWSMQEYSPKYGANKTTWLSNIFVADMLYKFSSSFSTRLELQYLVTQEDNKDWMAAMLEVSFAPHWSLYVSDMYNHGMTKVHYYNGGVSYTKSRTRVALNYGRFREGLLCSGGVCRQIPAYTGANLSVMMSF
ncbi:MAG: hypothetical protein IKY16_01200 [Bacteroidales bacterium]|jgi:hypothetical protein|nr:hypothetical protein [Bacteroidales bacterium]